MRIGVLGAGQLGQLMALKGIPLGLSFHFYSPVPPSPQFCLGQVTTATWEDEGALKIWAQSVDCVTLETENVPVATLNYLTNCVPVYPPIPAVQISQDRWLEKNFLQSLHLPTNAFYAVDDYTSLLQAAAALGFPFMLKQRSQGYDGKGQRCVRDQAALTALRAVPLQGLLAESWVPFEREVSIIGVRMRGGATAYYPLSENKHAEGILQHTRVRAGDPMQALAESYLQRLMTAWDYVGVLTLEMFQCGQTLLMNEIAPRVHNSGHWTLDAAVTSQFENHLRAILGWPLGDTRQLVACDMYNLLGRLPPTPEMLNQANTRYYSYGKSPAPGRKLGHVTVLAS